MNDFERAQKDPDIIHLFINLKLNYCGKRKNKYTDIYTYIL